MHLHVMFQLFPEICPSRINFPVVKKTFQKCNPTDFKIYRGELTNKHFPIRCNVNFEIVFIAINNTPCKENRPKINIIPYGEMFLLVN